MSQDAERLARFEREAKLLACLNHPNIAAIHSVHEADGMRFLAMELVVPTENLIHPSPQLPLGGHGKGSTRYQSEV